MRQFSKLKKTFCSSKIVVPGLFLIALLTIIPGCSRRENKKGQEKYITIKGSDTMVHLVTNWADAFMKKNPEIEISVTGGGSGTGIAALINGTTDICASSREITENEKKLAQKQGVDPTETAVALDGIAIVVNPANPVTELSMAQLKSVFTGNITRWNQVGGPDQQILLLSRESSSGTFLFFQEYILEKQDYAHNAKLMPATSAIIQSVSSDKWAIGYIGLGYAVSAAEDIKILAIKTKENTAVVKPSEETVKSGKYPIARPLLVYTKSNGSETLKKFIAFCLSSEGQQIVKTSGYITVK